LNSLTFINNKHLFLIMQKIYNNYKNISNNKLKLIYIINKYFKYYINLKC